MKRLIIRNKLILGIILILLASGFIIFHPSVPYEIYKTSRSVPKDSDFTLVIYTDIHHDPEKDELHPLKETMECVAKMMKLTRIDALWNLGDLINGHTTTKAEAIEQMNEVMAEENRVSENAHRVAGNHDNNIQATYSTNAGYGMGEMLSNSELNAVLENTATSQTEHHSALRPTDYYVDFPEIRVVCITAENTTWTEETAVWLKETALITTSQVLILAHCPTRPEWGFQNDIVNGELIETEIQRFTDNGGTIIAYIHGHDHGDMISDTGDWKEICIGCARFQEPKSNGTKGMTFPKRSKWNATKILFDVVSIDIEKREVHFIRFGAGEDWVIQY